MTVEGKAEGRESVVEDEEGGKGMSGNNLCDLRLLFLPVLLFILHPPPPPPPPPLVDVYIGQNEKASQL